MPDLPDYKVMYAVLCAALSDGIDLIAQNRVTEAVDLMQRELLRAEDIGIE